MDQFKLSYNKYNYVYQKILTMKETRICQIPKLKSGQKAVKNISWYTQDNVSVYATMWEPATSEFAKWEEITPNTTLSPHVTALKFVNNTSTTRVVIVRLVVE